MIRHKLQSIWNKIISKMPIGNPKVLISKYAFLDLQEDVEHLEMLEEASEASTSEASDAEDSAAEEEAVAVVAVEVAAAVVAVAEAADNNFNR